MGAPCRQRWHQSFCSGSWVQADGQAAFAWSVSMSFSVFCEVIFTEVATLISFDAGFYSICFQGLPQNFRKEHLMKWAGMMEVGDASFDKESRMLKWKQNSCVFLFVLALVVVVRLNKPCWRREEPDMEEISLKVKYTFLMHIRSNKLLLVLLKLDTAQITFCS